MTPRPPTDPDHTPTGTSPDAQDAAPASPVWDADRTDLQSAARAGDWTLRDEDPVQLGQGQPNPLTQSAETPPTDTAVTTIPTVRRDTDDHARATTPQPQPQPPTFWAEHIDPSETIQWFGAPIIDATTARKAPTSRAERLRPVLIGMIGVAAGFTLLGSDDERFIVKAVGMGVLVLGALMIGRTLTGSGKSRLQAHYLVTDRAIYIASLRANDRPYVARYALTRTMPVTRTDDSLFFTVGQARGREDDKDPILVSFRHIPDPEATLDLIHDLQKAMK